jgi:hypothetical protein
MQIETGLNRFIENFGQSNSGKLANLRYTVKDAAGADVIARTNTGIVEIGFGAYRVDITFNTVGVYHIIWDIDGEPKGVADSINVVNAPISSDIIELIPL